MVREEVDLLNEKASEVVTLRGGSQKPLIGEQMKDLGIIRGGSIAVNEGKIVAVGKTSEIEKKFEGLSITGTRG